MRAARGRSPAPITKLALSRGGARGTDLEASGFFRKLFQASPVAMLVRSTRGRLVDANPACERLLGYTAEELRRHPLRVLTHPDDLEETVSLLQDLIAGRRDQVSLEKRYRRKDGTLIWARSAVAAVRGDTGGVEHLVFLIEDVTERKRAEEALRESEARFRQLAEHIQDGVWMATADFSQILYLSPAIERMWGVTREELSANPIANRDFIHPDDRERVIAEFPKQIEAPFEQQYRVISQMVKDLEVPVSVRRVPILRESDGLAMSSRNVYLSAVERQDALILSRTLKFVEQRIGQGEYNCTILRTEMKKEISTVSSAVLDYVSIADAETLEELSRLIAGRSALVSLAVRVGTTRLIDNTIINIS